jgi:GNAT superfamily N-acetyltransferase
VKPDKPILPQKLTIRSFRQEDIPKIIDMHELLYAEEWGLNTEFRDYVSIAMDKFIGSFDHQAENLWIAEFDAAFAGSIAIVKADTQTAQLRWLLVEPDMRRKGIGNLLVQTAVDFCKEKGYSHTILWTLSFLKTARHIYERFGFYSTITKESHIWGKDLVEECWELVISPDMG